MHNCTCILLSSRDTPEKGLSCSAPSPTGRSTGIHARILRGIFINFSWATRNKIYQYFRTDKSYWPLRSRATLGEGFMLFSSLPRKRRYCRKLSTLWPCILGQSITSKVHLSGFQNREGLLTTTQKDLCCLAPSPAGWRYCRKLSTTEDARSGYTLAVHCTAKV